jgi:L-ascorbate metabolism protein UlaG (beta-lactamase superfamily)
MVLKEWSNMIIKWLDHASLLIETKGKKIYIDPYAGEYTEEADVIMISHAHRDHCDHEKIQAIRRPDTLIITSEECAKGLSGNVTTMSPGDVKEVYGVTIEAVEAYNFKRFRSPGVPYHPKGIGIGFVIEADGKRIYHVGDSDLIPSMEGLKDIDVAFIPIMGRAIMDVDEAVEAAIAINPKVAIPVHRRDNSAEEFKEKLEARSDIKALASNPGDVIDP